MAKLKDEVGNVIAESEVIVEEVAGNVTNLVEAAIGRGEGAVRHLDNEAKTAIGDAIRNAGLPLNPTALSALVERIADAVDEHIDRIFG